MILPLSHIYHSLDVTFLEVTPFFASPQSDSPLDEDPEDSSLLPRLLPLFDSPLETPSSLPPVVTTAPTQVYSHCPPA